MLRSFLIYAKHLYEERVWIAFLVFALSTFITLHTVLTRNLQHDFKTYYYGVRAYTQNLNPYDLNTLSLVAPEQIRFPFLYPPIALYIFSPLSWVDFPLAYQLFLLLKIVALAVLVLLWFMYFTTTKTERVLLFFFLVLGFNQTVGRDIMTGNVSLFEQTMLWASFLFLVRGKDVLFALLFFLATLLKPLSLLMLLPLFFVLKTRALKPTAIVILLVLVVHGVAALIEPELTIEFLRHAHLPQERLVSNPSALEIMRIISQREPQVSQAFGPYSASVLYGIFALILLGTGALVIPRYGLHTGLMGALVLSALVAPRFKDYSYILLIVPSVLLLSRIARHRIVQLLGVVLVCTHGVVSQPFLAALFFFGILAYYSFSRSEVDHDSASVVS